MSLYQGYAQQRGFSANRVDIPDPAEKIRKQGLQQLSYMQDELDAKNKQALDLAEVFNQNIELEQKLRSDSFQDKREYGRVLARNKWKNFETSIQSARTKSEQKRKDWQALLSLTKSGAQLIKQYDTKRKQDIDTFAAEIYRDYGIGKEKFDAIRNWQKGVRLNDQGLNSLVLDLKLKGTPTDVISRVRSSGGYINLAVGKLAARRRAIQLQQYLAEEANTDLNLPGYKGLTLNNARGANVETALQELTSRFFKDENGEQLFSSKMMELANANKYIDEAKITWRRRDTERTNKEEKKYEHRNTKTLIQDFLGPDDEGNLRGAAGIPMLIEHLAGGKHAQGRNRAQKYRIAKSQVHAGLLELLDDGTVKWDQIKRLETLDVDHPSSKEKQPWIKLNARQWTELEQAGLRRQAHENETIKLKDEGIRREGREFYENMIKLNEEYEGGIPDSVMQSMIGYGTKRGHHFAAGVQYLQKTQASGLTTINDKVGTKALLAKSERGEIITTVDVNAWNLSKGVKEQVQAQVNKYNTWLPQEGKDGTKERLNFRIETKLNQIIKKKESWHESVTWNDTRIKANQDAARYYRSARETGASHEKAYEYARDMITKDLETGGPEGYYEKVSKGGRHEFKGALAKDVDEIVVNRQEILDELTANPDLIYSKKYIPTEDLKMLSGNANKGNWPEMHNTAMLIQSITKGKVQAVDVINAGLQQVISEETTASGASSTQLLPEAYVKKYREVNEHISPFAMNLLQSYNLCDINKACMAAQEDGSINQPVYTQPILNKAKPIMKEVEETGGTPEQNFFLERVSDLFNNKDGKFLSPFRMHDPALLNPEAYKFLYNNGRYQTQEVTP